MRGLCQHGLCTIATTAQIILQNKINFYHEYNVVYSIDSGEVYDVYMPDPHYYDIRHPLTSVLTFPVYAIVDFICGGYYWTSMG